FLTVSNRNRFVTVLFDGCLETFDGGRCIKFRGSVKRIVFFWFVISAQIVSEANFHSYGIARMGSRFRILSSTKEINIATRSAYVWPLMENALKNPAPGERSGLQLTSRI